MLPLDCDWLHPTYLALLCPICSGTLEMVMCFAVDSTVAYTCTGLWLGVLQLAMLWQGSCDAAHVFTWLLAAGPVEFAA